MQTSPPHPGFILLFGFILQPVPVQPLGCTEPWPHKSTGVFPTNTRRRNLSGEENAESVHVSFPWGKEMSTQGEVFREHGKIPWDQGEWFPHFTHSCLEWQ